MSGQRMTEGWEVRPTEDGDGNVLYYVRVPNRVRCQCNCSSCSGWKMEYRPHTNGIRFEDESDAHDWIEQVAEQYEAQYDQYLEENSYQIAQMERYEAWRQEY